MRNKIKMLILVIEGYERLKAPITGEKIDDKFEFLAKYATDKDWFKDIGRSFKKALAEKQEPRVWLAKQLDAFGIYEANESFQKNEIDHSHCLSFVYHFLHDKYDDYFCDHFLSINERLGDFSKDLLEKKESDLKPGDLIIYQNDYGFSHTAISLGKIQDKDYAISKFGEGNAVYLHPVLQVPDSYGRAVCFDMQSKLEPSSKAKLEELRKELDSKELGKTKSQTGSEIKHPPISPRL